METAIQIISPETTDLQESAGTMTGQAAMLTVKDDASFTVGGEMLLEIKKRAKLVEERFAEPVSAANKAHKALTALRDSVLAPFRSAETTIKGKLGTYQAEVEQARRIEAERLRKQAEAQAEADRIQKAQDLMDKGDLKACEQTLNAPIAPVAIKVVTPEPPKVAGLSFREEWDFEIVDSALVPSEYKIVDEVKLRKVVKALGKAASNINGIRVFSRKVVSGRAA